MRMERRDFASFCVAVIALQIAAEARELLGVLFYLAKRHAQARVKNKKIDQPSESAFSYSFSVIDDNSQIAALLKYQGETVTPKRLTHCHDQVER